MSCGYHLARRGDKIPATIHTMSVPVFKNETYEAGIEDLLTDAFIQAIQNKRWVRIAPAEDADAVLTGVVKKFITVPIAFAETDFAAEYRIRIKCKLTLRDSRSKELWIDKEVTLSEEFQVTPDIFTSENNKRQAIARLAADMAEEVHDRIFDGF